MLALSCAQDPEAAKRRHEQNGDRFAAEGKFREAIIEYRQAVAIDDRFGEARLKLGDAYLRVNDGTNALRQYVRAADLLDNASTHLKAGQLLLIAGQYEDAKGRAEKALAREPQNAGAHLLRGAALAGLTDVGAAVTEVETAIKEDPSRAASYAALAMLQLSQGALSIAESSFLQAVKIDPTSVQAHLALANFYWRTNRPKDAEPTIAAVLKLAPDDPLANRFAAAFYVSTGRVAEAEAPLKVLAAKPEAMNGRLLLADYYGGTKRVDEAKQLLRKVAGEPGGLAAANQRLARIAIAEGDRAAAERLLADTLEAEPKNAVALTWKAELRLTEGKYDEALTSARLAVEADDRAPRAHYVLGRAFAAKSEFTQAEAAFQEALRLNPRFALATVELAKVKLAMRKADEAVQLAESMLKTAPNNSEAQMVIVRGQMQRGQLEAAEKALRSLSRAFPEAPAVNVELGRLLMAKGEQQRAREAFERALDRNAGQLGALQGLTTLDMRAKRVAEARARIEKAVAAQPTNDELRLLAGRIYSAENPSAAEQAFKHAIELNPNNMRAYTALSAFYGRQKRLPEATRELERVLERRPTDFGVRTALGMLLEMQNRQDEAIQRYEQALEMNPRAAVAANNLAWLYAERGQKLDIARQLAQLAKAELPNSPEVSDTLGWVHYKNNAASLAVEPFREAVNREPDNASYHLHLGLAYAKTGEPQKARESVERALSLDPKVAGADEARAALAAVGQRLSR